ncbi:MAG: 50S ribosomal protein L21 [bacterium]|nr:50S ribosomal protein L21 [Gemmatimonadota bacterium]
MYAIVQTGGRQFRLELEGKLQIPKLEAQPGQKVEFDRVLLVHGDSGVTVGSPTVSGAKVVAEVVRQGRDPKVVVFHKKRRKRYTKRAGHRQPFTEILVKQIVGA